MIIFNMFMKSHYCPAEFDHLANHVCHGCQAEKHIGASKEEQQFGAVAGGIAGLVVAYWLFGPFLPSNSIQSALIQNDAITGAVGAGVGFMGIRFLLRNRVVWKRQMKTSH